MRGHRCLRLYVVIICILTLPVQQQFSSVQTVKYLTYVVNSWPAAMNSQHHTQYLKIPELRICHNAVILIMCMSPSVSRYCVSLVVYIPMAIVHHTRNVTELYTVHVPAFTIGHHQV